MESVMAPFALEEENVDDLYSLNNTQPTEPQSEEIQNTDNMNDNPLTSSLPTKEVIPPQKDNEEAPKPIIPSQQQTESQSIPEIQEERQKESKNEFVDLKYDDDENDNNNNNMDNNDDDNDDDDDIEIDIDLPIVDSLQPDELCVCINDTINKMSECNPGKDIKVIMSYKANLIEQLEKLQIISKAIDSLNEMQKTAENLPKNRKTGYPDINAINLALREHCFFAEQINVFGMLLIEICDIKKLNERYSTEYSNLLMMKICETINDEFIYQHLLFHYSSNRLIVLVYIENEEELMICGKEIIHILTCNSFEIKDQILHSSVSIGAAMINNNNNNINDDEKGGNIEENTFDFRTWIKNAELSLNKANNSGLINQCCIAKEDDIIRAIVPSMNDNNGNISNHNKHNKSTLSLLARGRGHSSGGLSYNKLKLGQITNNLSPKQIRASIILYDKLSRLKIKNNNDYKLIALSLCRRLKEEGANYNFKHPKFNGNTILMLCCLKNLDIIIKYFCLKLYQEIDFNVINNDGNNALMIAILNKDINNKIIKMIAEKTTDKLVINHNGKNALQLTQQMGRNDLIAMLQ